MSGKQVLTPLTALRFDSDCPSEQTVLNRCPVKAYPGVIAPLGQGTSRQTEDCLYRILPVCETGDDFRKECAGHLPPLSLFEVQPNSGPFGEGCSGENPFRF